MRTGSREEWGEGRGNMRSENTKERKWSSVSHELRRADRSCCCCCCSRSPLSLSVLSVATVCFAFLLLFLPLWLPVLNAGDGGVREKNFFTSRFRTPALDSPFVRRVRESREPAKQTNRCKIFFRLSNCPDEGISHFWIHGEQRFSQKINCFSGIL